MKFMRELHIICHFKVLSAITALEALTKIN